MWLGWFSFLWFFALPWEYFQCGWTFFFLSKLWRELGKSTVTKPIRVNVGNIRPLIVSLFSMNIFSFQKQIRFLLKSLLREPSDHHVPKVIFFHQLLPFPQTMLEEVEKMNQWIGMPSVSQEKLTWDLFFKKITKTEGHLALHKSRFLFFICFTGEAKGFVSDFQYVFGELINLFSLFLCHSGKHFDIILQIMENERIGKTETLCDTVKNP